MTKLLSRRVAVLAAIAAAVVVAFAVASRAVALEDPDAAPAASVAAGSAAQSPQPAFSAAASPSVARAVARSGSGSVTPGGSAGVVASAVPAPASAIAAASAVSLLDPEIGAIQATVLPAERGIDITLALAIRVAVPLPPRSAIWLRAECAVAGEWYGGTARIALDDIAGGEHVVAHVVVGRDYRLAALPTACHLAFQRDMFVRGADATLAIRCWNGRAVVDGRCPPIPRLVNGKPVLALHRLAVRGDVDRGAAPRYLTVELEAELARALDWRARITAECRLPDGTAQSDTASISLRYRPGAPFLATAMVFSRRRLAAAPSQCTLGLDLVDDHELASEPVAVHCWSNGAVTPGACKP